MNEQELDAAFRVAKVRERVANQEIKEANRKMFAAKVVFSISLIAWIAFLVVTF